MKRTLVTLVMTVFLVATLSGCIGSGGFGGGAPRAIVKVQQVGEETYLFDGSDSSGKGLGYEWDFGDGTTATDARVEHTYEYGDATYDVRLVITDSEGTKDVWEDEIVVGSGENRPPVALFQAETRNYEVDSPVRVDASGSSDPDGAPLRYKWDFNYLMDFDEYTDFRAAKKAALENSSDDEGDFDVGGGGDDPNGQGLAQGDPGLRDTVEKADPTGIFGKKHAGHGDDGPDIERSIFSHEVETEEPVYVMEEGYPDATTFFIKLEVTDVAGGFEEIVSEEIWAVEVYQTGKLPAKTASDGTSGELDIGIPAQAEEFHDQIPDAELYTYQAEWEFTLDWPVAPAVQDGTNYDPGGYINLTWSAESDAGAESILEMNVTSPSGKSMSPPSNDGGSAKIQLDGNNDYVEGNWDTPWRVQITARSGVNITWEVEYWVKMVTNPFLEFEDGA